MKRYIKPTCDGVNVATEETMAYNVAMSMKVHDQLPILTGQDESLLILDGSEILTNSRLWEEDEEGWK